MKRQTTKMYNSLDNQKERLQHTKQHGCTMLENYERSNDSGYRGVIPTGENVQIPSMKLEELYTLFQCKSSKGGKRKLRRHRKKRQTIRKKRQTNKRKNHKKKTIKYRK